MNLLKNSKVSQKKRIESRIDSKRGKGSHVTLYFGDRFTILRNPKDELKTGTAYHGIRLVAYFQFRLTKEAITIAPQL